MLRSFKKKQILSLLIASAMTFSLVTPVTAKADTTGSNSNQVDLQILTTTDAHGRFLPYDYAINATDTTGSLAQVATVVKQLRAKNPNTIVVDAGDIIQDNSESLFLDGSTNPMMLAMNEIGYDTLTLGNHEFNYGMSTLKKVISQFKGTVLCGNVYNTDGSRLAAPYTVVDKGGVKVGIIGMTTPNITKWDGPNLEGYKVTNPIDETKAAVAELKKQNVDLIVAVDHMGEGEEYNASGSGAMDVLDQCPEINAFVAAHFHNEIAGDYFYNHKVYSLNKAKNTVTVTAMDGTTSAGTVEEFNTAKASGTVIVEAGKGGKDVGQVNFTLTKNAQGKYEVSNKATDVSATLYNMSPKGGTTVESDPALVAKLSSFNQKAIDDANSVIGTLKGGDLVSANEISGIEQAKLQPTAMIDLINKVQMYYGEKVANHKIDVSSAAAFKDGANIKEGSIKKSGTADIYKFDNTLYVVKITGSQLKKYMEWSASYYNKFNPGDLTVSFNKSIPGYNYDMFTGVKYKVDISKDNGSRIVDLTKMDGTPIQDSEVLYMSVNNYRAGTQLLSRGTVFGANDTLPTLVGKSEQTQGLGDGRIRDLIGSYIKDVKGGTITPESDNNWSVIGNSWNSHERALAVKYINNGTISLAGIAGEQTSNNSKSVTWDDVKKAMNPNGNKVIDIVSFNDLHGTVEEQGKNIGMGKLAQAIKEYKQANPNTVVVSGGDSYQGSAMSNLTHGAPVSAMMKEVGVVASAVGNHEFDWGTQWISKWAQDGNFDFLASNIYSKTTGKPADFAKPYKIVTVNGVKVGFVGLSTPETAFKTKPENVADLEFRDPAKAAKEWADKLKSGTLPEGKADVVIALTHMGSAQDATTGNITGEVVDSGLCNVDSIDAVISAHTHQPVCGTVNNKPVVQGYYNGRDLADLSIEIDSNTGKLIKITPSVDKLYARTATLAADKTATDTFNAYKTQVAPILEKVEGVTDTELTYDAYGYKGTSVLGKWACDVMRNAAGTQIGITNGGGLRCPIPAGKITMGTLYQVMPFDNTLVKMNLKGSDLKKVIENGIANSNIGWVQVSGLKVYYDAAKPQGDRITAMVLDNGTKIDMNGTYSVVTNDFMATGGDNYDFKAGQNVVDTGIPIRDSLASALEALNGKHLVVNYSDSLINGAAPVVNPTKPTENPTKPSDNNNTKPSDNNNTKPNNNNNTKPNTNNTTTTKVVPAATKTVAQAGSLPKTGSEVDTNAIAGFGAIALMLGCALTVSYRKNRKEEEAA